MCLFRVTAWYISDLDYRFSSLDFNVVHALLYGHSFVPKFALSLTVGSEYLQFLSWNPFSEKLGEDIEIKTSRPYSQDFIVYQLN